VDGQSQASQQQHTGLARRTFLKRAAIGASALGAVALVPLAAKHDESTEAAAAALDEQMTATGPILVYVRHAERGEAVLMQDGAERAVTDRALVSQLLRAQRDHLG
jgi:hypothetical protein